MINISPNLNNAITSSLKLCLELTKDTCSIILTNTNWIYIYIYIDSYESMYFMSHSEKIFRQNTHSLYLNLKLMNLQLQHSISRDIQNIQCLYETHLMTFSLFIRMCYFGVVRLISLPMNPTPVFYTISTVFPHFHHDTSFDTRFTFHDSRHTFQIVTIDFNRS